MLHYEYFIKRYCLPLCFIIFCGVSNASESIFWKNWQAPVFQHAANQNKLIMVNVGYEGCTACRWMKNNTFADKQVITLLNKHFVSIQVDSEARPDIGERYSDWAWPATIFMLPDATQVLALRGTRRPDIFINILERLVAGHKKNTLKPDELAPYSAPTQTRSSLIDIRNQVRGQLDRSFDKSKGGWGKEKVLENNARISQLWLRSYLYEDVDSKAKAIKTVDGLLKQIDPVWGGMFYASLKEWGNVLYELRLESQAAALAVFSEAYHITKNSKYKNAISSIDSYLQNHMRSSDGLYYSSQQDRVEGLPKNLSMAAYYALDDKKRRQYGLPVTDTKTYTHLNARIVSAYIAAYSATGNAQYLDTAIKAAQALKKRLTADGWAVQLVTNAKQNTESRIHLLDTIEQGHLRPQAYLGLAMLELYQHTSEKKWLKTAKRIAASLLETFEDSSNGGFYSTQYKKNDALPIEPRKPLEDNAVAARFLYLLGILVKNKEWQESAERAMQASAVETVVRREGKITGNTALTLELLINGYVEFSVVTKRKDDAAKSLLMEGLRTYEPRKIVHYEKPGRYPSLKQPAMYICNPDACSVPIFNRKNVYKEAQRFRPVAFGS